MATLAIVGSRTWRELWRVEAFVLALPRGTRVVSGGARGVDLEAARVARARGLEVVEWLPEGEAEELSWGQRCRARNERIVEDADALVAFWDGRSRGTRSAIGLGRAKGIRVVVAREGTWTRS